MPTDFPSKELLEVIRSQARMEEKLDAFIKNASSMQTKLTSIEADVAELKAARKADKAVFATLSALFGTAMAFIVPFARKYFGI